MQHYRRVSYEQRCQISAFLETKISIQEISKRLKLHRATIYRELSRNKDSHGRYNAYIADHETQVRKMSCRRRKLLSDPERLNIVETALREHLSPEQIAGRFKVISHQTIYNALNTDHERLRVYLRRYGKRRGRGRKGRRKARERASWHVPISERPKHINQRKESGHWERDTMYLKDRKMMLICIERKTRYVRIEKLEKLRLKNVHAQSINMMQDCGKKILTITNDNGSEFMGDAKTEVPVYFCDPYSPQQRGSVENIIGLIRQYLTRTTDIKKLSKEKIKEIEAKLNHRPRKCLNFKTPYEMMFGSLSH